MIDVLKKCGWVLALALVGGCTPQDANTSDATLPAPAITLNFATAKAVTPARMAEIFPEFSITDPEVTPAPLIFGYGRLDAVDLREPVLLRQSRGTWSFVEMPSLNHTDWVYVGRAYERGELWAILDSTPESKGAGLYLLRSTDNGLTWAMFSGVKPPTLQAEFVGFSMTIRGVGQLSVHQDDDTEATPRGTYTYTSADAGKTWRGPAFASDDLITADPAAYPTLSETLQSLNGGDATHAGPANMPPRAAPHGRGRGG